jgi:hypothetical protein
MKLMIDLPLLKDPELAEMLLKEAMDALAALDETNGIWEGRTGDILTTEVQPPRDVYNLYRVTYHGAALQWVGEIPVVGECMKPSPSVARVIEMIVDDCRNSVGRVWIKREWIHLMERESINRFVTVKDAMMPEKDYELLCKLNITAAFTIDADETDVYFTVLERSSAP